MAGQDFDCGEGIHLSGVTHSTIGSNRVEHNSGGILLSDDTGLTSDNLISGNVVNENPFDCAITLASHHFEFGFNPAFGVFHTPLRETLSPAMVSRQTRGPASVFSQVLREARTMATS